MSTSIYAATARCLLNLNQLHRDGVSDHDDVAYAHIHIPKTAGMYFQRPLLENLRPSVLLHWQHPVSHLRDLLSKAGAPNYKLFAGHIGYQELEDQLASRKMRYFAVLRDPIERTISEYNYCRSENHPEAESFFASFPTFDRYIEYICDVDRNRQTYFLSGTRNSSRHLCDVLRSQYVGLAPIHKVYSFRKALTTSIARTYGFKYFNLELVSKQSKTNNLTKIRFGEIVQYKKVDSSLRKKFETANGIDIAVYNAVAKEYPAVEAVIAARDFKNRAIRKIKQVCDRKLG